MCKILKMTAVFLAGVTKNYGAVIRQERKKNMKNESNRNKIM